jgi:hypothetical protein
MRWFNFVLTETYRWWRLPNSEAAESAPRLSQVLGSSREAGQTRRRLWFASLRNLDLEDGWIETGKFPVEKANSWVWQDADTSSDEIHVTRREVLLALEGHHRLLNDREPCVEPGLHVADSLQWANGSVLRPKVAVCGTASNRTGTLMRGH